MVVLPVLAVTLLACVSRLHAVRTCDADITAGFLAQTQAPVSYVQQFSNMTAWLVAASPDTEFGATETYHLSFNESCGNLVLIYITQLFSDGTETKHTHALIKEYDSVYYHEPGYELLLNFFVCDADLVAAYKCQTQADGKTLFLILGPYGKTAAEMDVESCKAKISAIYPAAEFKDMGYPAATPLTVDTDGLLDGVVDGVVDLVGSVVGNVLSLG